MYYLFALLVRVAAAGGPSTLQTCVDKDSALLLTLVCQNRSIGTVLRNAQDGLKSLSTEYMLESNTDKSMLSIYCLSSALYQMPYSIVRVLFSLSDRATQQLVNKLVTRWRCFDTIYFNPLTQLD